MKVKREKFRTMLCYLVPENVIYVNSQRKRNIRRQLSQPFTSYNSKRYSKSSKFKGGYWSFETHPLKKPLSHTALFCLDCMLSIIRGRKG